MRGKAVVLHYATHTNRITPAYAGKRMSQMAYTSMCQDHPRLCGEKLSQLRLNTVVIGSPPPMRGKVIISKYTDGVHGITPAYAGKR